MSAHLVHQSEVLCSRRFEWQASQGSSFCGSVNAIATLMRGSEIQATKLCLLVLHTEQVFFYCTYCLNCPFKCYYKDTMGSSCYNQLLFSFCEATLDFKTTSFDLHCQIRGSESRRMLLYLESLGKDTMGSSCYNQLLFSFCEATLDFKTTSFDLHCQIRGSESRRMLLHLESLGKICT